MADNAVQPGVDDLLALLDLHQVVAQVDQRSVQLIALLASLRAVHRVVEEDLSHFVLAALESVDARGDAALAAHRVDALAEDAAARAAQVGTVAVSYTPQHAAPLVVQLGQVPVGVDDIFVVLTEERLAGGTNAVALLQRLAAAGGDPGALRREALHMILLLLQQALRDEHGKVYVLVAGGFKLPVQLVLHVLPDGVAVGAVDEHSLDAGVVDQLRFSAHVCEPLCKVYISGGDSVYLAFIL